MDLILFWALKEETYQILTDTEKCEPLKVLFILMHLFHLMLTSGSHDAISFKFITEGAKTRPDVTVHIDTRRQVFFFKVA